MCGASSSPAITALKKTQRPKLMNNPSLYWRDKETISVPVCVHAIWSHSLTIWLSGPERNWDKVFSGHLASGTMPSQPQSEQTWRQTYTHTHTILEKHPNTHVSRFRTTGSPLICIHTCTSPHTNTLIIPHTRKPFQSACEMRVVRKTACLRKKKKKRALPCLRDKHHSVTRFSGHCFLTVYLIFPSFVLTVIM